MYWLLLGTFVVFFFVIGPALLYWFIRFGSHGMLEKPPSFIGFPQDDAPP